MTTELTLREKVLDTIFQCTKLKSASGKYATPEQLTDRIADLLSATGAPAYIRVADDLRGVVREEGE